MAIVYCIGQNRSGRVVLNRMALPPMVILEIHGSLEPHCECGQCP